MDSPAIRSTTLIWEWFGSIRSHLTNVTFTFGLDSPILFNALFEDIITYLLSCEFRTFRRHHPGSLLIIATLIRRKTFTTEKNGFISKCENLSQPCWNIAMLEMVVLPLCHPFPAARFPFFPLQHIWCSGTFEGSRRISASCSDPGRLTTHGGIPLRFATRKTLVGPSLVADYLILIFAVCMSKCWCFASLTKLWVMWGVLLGSWLTDTNETQFSIGPRNAPWHHSKTYSEIKKIHQKIQKSIENLSHKKPLENYPSIPLSPPQARKLVSSVSSGKSSSRNMWGPPIRREAHPRRYENSVLLEIARVVRDESHMTKVWLFIGKGSLGV